jgi:hypothetical protein
LYNVKVKNTFLEVADDHTHSELDFDELDVWDRQVSEPAPAITRILDTPNEDHDDQGVRPQRQTTEPLPFIHRCSDIPKPSKIQEFQENMSGYSTAFSETHDESNRKGSTASSEHDSEGSVPFHPECNFDLAYYGNEMAQQIAQGLSPNALTNMQWKPHIKQTCFRSPVSPAVAGQYTVENDVHTIAAAALLGTQDVSERTSADLIASNDNTHDVDASCTTKRRRRRRRDSLIDTAAKGQREELIESKMQTKHETKQQPAWQPVSNTLPSGNKSPSGWSRRNAPTTKLATNFCFQCGSESEPPYKFCGICGASVSFIQ